MHPAVADWVRQYATSDQVAVLDIGGRDLNGTVCCLFPGADPYVVMDIRPGPNVDIVANAAAWLPDRPYDVVVCCEVFEHTYEWADICATAYRALAPGGKFIFTCAGPGRAPHSGVEAVPNLAPGEYYRNIGPDEIRNTLEWLGFLDITVRQLDLDTQGVASK